MNQEKEEQGFLEAIRKDPVGAATGMARKVFGLLGK